MDNLEATSIEVLAYEAKASRGPINVVHMGPNQF